MSDIPPFVYVQCIRKLLSNTLVASSVILPQPRCNRPLFALLLDLFSAHGTIPRPVGLALEPYTRPMEPLIGAVVVVAGYHVSKANVVAETVLSVITAFFLVLCIANGLVAVGIPVVSGRRATRLGVGAVFSAAAALRL